MNNREIKNVLKERYDKIEVPSYDSSLIQKLEDARLNQEVKTSKKSFSFWKALIPSLGIVLAGGVILTVALTIPPTSSILPQQIELTKAKSVIGKEVMMASVLANDINNDSNVKRMRMSSSAYQNSVETIHQYLLTGEMMINKNNIVMEVYYNEDENYDYQYRMDVCYDDSMGEDTQYTFYYNEKALLDDDDDLDEVSISFQGLLLMDNTEYQVFGERENEENEEYSIETTISLNGEKLLTAKQETEINENEYTYIYYQNNQVIREVSQEIEIENGRKEMSISIEENQKEQEFQFEYLDNNKIRCEYELEDGDVELEIELMITEFETYYLYQTKGQEDIKIQK